MNKNYTLKELADIAKAAAEEANKESRASEWGVAMPTSNRPAFILTRVTQAILDAIGYEFPKDEEREAFERWLAEQGDGFHPCGDVGKAFLVWKAGREALRLALAKDEEEPTQEPAWIPWNGGECPLPDTVKRWQYRFRYQGQRDCPEFGGDTSPSNFRWAHEEGNDDIIAYRVWE